MADCRSLVEFLRAFERRRRASADPSPCSNRPRPRPRRATSCSSSPRRRPFTALCDHSPATPTAALDVLALLAVLSALAFLAAPYARLLALEAADLLRSYPDDEPYSHVAFAAGAGAAVTAVAGLLAWEAAGHRARRCGRPRCRGLRKAVEFDIQLETEECVRGTPPLVPGRASALFAAAGQAVRSIELGEEHRELEAELRKMAPPNGRSVLIFRAPCGCAKGRMEVWGAKKVRRIKK